MAVELDGRVVGGLRVQGPYTQVDQAYALREWAGREGTDELRRQIGRRLERRRDRGEGGLGRRDSAARHNELTAAMARMFVQSLGMSGSSLRVLHGGLSCGAALAIQRRSGERRCGAGGLSRRAVSDIAAVVGPTDMSSS